VSIDFIHDAGNVVEVKRGSYWTNPSYHADNYVVELDRSELGLIISRDGTEEERIYCVMRSKERDFLLVRNSDIIGSCRDGD